jgi:hypothetical protein
MMKTALILVSALLSLKANAQCADTSNIYSFQYNGANYEVVKENKTWTDAAACAVERGGFLSEINDQMEQDAVYDEALNNAGISVSNTVAPDGGGASYVWVGGNDLATEGEWTWDGDNDGSGSQFWQGTSTGSPVGGLYSNWGNEPDDFGNGQDGLGLAITDWPLGVSGQWNDVNDGNDLYFIIEYPLNASVDDLQGSVPTIYFEREGNKIKIVSVENMPITDVKMVDATGKIMHATNSNELDISSMPVGMYFLQVSFENGALEVLSLTK